MAMSSSSNASDPLMDPLPPPPTLTGDRGRTFEIVTIVFFFIACAFVGLRIYSRIHLKRLRQIAHGVGYDEFFAVIALLFAAGLTVCIAIGVKYGLGKHVQNPSLDLVEHVQKVTYFIIVLIILCLGALRNSILCLYLRVTPVQSHRRAIYGVLALQNTHIIIAFFISVFQCSPISDYWILKETKNCLWEFPIDTFNSAFTVLMDLIVWLLPLPVIYNLHAARSKKVGLYVVFAVSSFSVICSMIRLYHVTAKWKETDALWDKSYIPFISALEAYIALCTSSIPPIYPLIIKRRKASRSYTPKNIGSDKKRPAHPESGLSTNPSSKWTMYDTKTPLSTTQAGESELDSFPPGKAYQPMQSSATLHKTSEDITVSVSNKNDEDGTWKPV